MKVKVRVEGIEPVLAPDQVFEDVLVHGVQVDAGLQIEVKFDSLIDAADAIERWLHACGVELPSWKRECDRFDRRAAGLAAQCVAAEKMKIDLMEQGQAWKTYALKLEGLIRAGTQEGGALSAHRPTEGAADAHQESSVDP